MGPFPVCGCSCDGSKVIGEEGGRDAEKYHSPSMPGVKTLLTDAGHALMPLGQGFCCREQGLLVPSWDSSLEGQLHSEFSAGLAEVSVETILQLRLPLLSPFCLPSFPSLPFPGLSPNQLPTNPVLGWASWGHRACSSRQGPETFQANQKTSQLIRLFNILIMMQTGISRLLLNSIKLEDKNYTEEHAASTAWTTSQRAWGGRQSFEEGAGARGTLGGD